MFCDVVRYAESHNRFWAKMRAHTQQHSTENKAARWAYLQKTRGGGKFYKSLGESVGSAENTMNPKLRGKTANERKAWAETQKKIAAAAWTKEHDP